MSGIGIHLEASGGGRTWPACNRVPSYSDTTTDPLRVTCRWCIRRMAIDAGKAPPVNPESKTARAQARLAWLEAVLSEAANALPSLPDSSAFDRLRRAVKEASK